MKKVLITISLMVFYLVMHAQSNFKNGYVVTLKGDTIHGAIQWQNDVGKSERCIFKNNSGHIKTYHPGGISAYRFENGRYFVTRFAKNQIEIKPVFAEYLVKGRKSLFYFKDGTGSHFLLSYQGDTLIEIPFSKKQDVDIGGKGNYSLQQIQTGFLKLYFKNEPPLYKDIDNIQDLSFNNLIALLKKYNRLVCGNNCYTVYYHVPSIKWAVEFRGGIVHLRGLTEHMYSPQFGALVYLRFPRITEKLAFKTGIMHGYYSEKSNRLSFYEIPLQFEYWITENHRVTPKLDVGYNYMVGRAKNGARLSPMVTIAGSAGAMIKLSKSAYFDLNFASDIYALTGGYEGIITYSWNGGVYLKF